MKKLLLTFLFPLMAFGQGTPMLRFDTVADMVARPIPTVNNSLSALVTGRVTANDGGGGNFYYQAGSSASTNLGTIFKPASSGGRWLRQYSGPLNVIWFGAVGDGVTDNYTAFTNAMTIAVSGPVFVPAGNFRINTTIDLGLLSSGVGLIGVGELYTFLDFFGTGYLFDIAAAINMNGVSFEKLRVNIQTSATGFLRVGRSTSTFAASGVKDKWNLKQVHIVGPGAAVAGKIGMTFARLGAAEFNQIQISDFERCWEMWTTTECLILESDLNTYKQGLWYDFLSGTPGGIKDTWVKGRFHGPTIAGGVSVYDNVVGLDFVGCYIEQSTAITARAMMEFGAGGRNFLSLGTSWDQSAASSTNTIYFAAGAVRNTFIGDRAGGLMATNFVGNPVGPGGTDIHLVLGCNDYFNASFGNYLLGPTPYAVLITHTNTGAFTPGPVRTGPLSAYSPAPGTTAHFTGLNFGGVVDFKADSAATFRFLNAAYSLVNLSLDDSGNGTFRGGANAQSGSLGLGVASVKVKTGTGTPEAAETADAGSIFLRNDGLTGRTVYVKQTGIGTTTGWRYPYDAVFRNAQAGTYQILVSDYYVVSTGTSAKTLPDASDVGAGKIIIVKSASGFTTTVTASAGDTVEGAATDVLGTLASGTYISDGVTNWEKN